jgi:hypothetical protein
MVKEFPQLLEQEKAEMSILQEAYKQQKNKQKTVIDILTQ